MTANRIFNYWTDNFEPIPERVKHNEPFKTLRMFLKNINLKIQELDFLMCRLEFTKLDMEKRVILITLLESCKKAIKIFDLVTAQDEEGIYNQDLINNLFKELFQIISDVYLNPHSKQILETPRNENRENAVKAGTIVVLLGVAALAPVSWPVAIGMAASSPYVGEAVAIGLDVDKKRPTSAILIEDLYNFLDKTTIEQANRVKETPAP